MNNAAPFREVAELDPYLLFTHSLWQDRCLGNLNGSKYVPIFLRSKRTSRNVRRGLFQQHVVLNTKANSEKVRQPFFYRLSQGLRIDTWKDDPDKTRDWCSPSDLNASKA